jgi:hypothetical protein
MPGTPSLSASWPFPHTASASAGAHQHGGEGTEQQHGSRIAQSFSQSSPRCDTAACRRSTHSHSKGATLRLMKCLRPLSDCRRGVKPAGIPAPTTLAAKSSTARVNHRCLEWVPPLVEVIAAYVLPAAAARTAHRLSQRSHFGSHSPASSAPTCSEPDSSALDCEADSCSCCALRFLRPIVLHGTKAGGTGRAGVRGGGVACHSVACAWRVCFGPVTSPTPATTNFPISLLTNPLRLAVGGLILHSDAIVFATFAHPPKLCPLSLRPSTNISCSHAQNRFLD